MWWKICFWDHINQCEHTSLLIPMESSMLRCCDVDNVLQLDRIIFGSHQNNYRCSMDVVWSWGHSALYWSVNTVLTAPCPASAEHSHHQQQQHTGRLHTIRRIQGPHSAVSVSTGSRGFFTFVKSHNYKGFHHMSCKMKGFCRTWRTSIEYGITSSF